MSYTPDQRHQLAAAWLRYWRWFSSGDTEPPVPHPDEWANDAVMTIMREGREEALDVLLSMVEQAPEDLLESIGAGPFEDWVTEERAERLSSRISTELRNNAKFRKMVRSAWDLPAVINDALAAVRLED
jgi:hypothetical protein